MNGKQLKNSILQWAIQGKLVPQDPNDEPASVLLEKIRGEKERLIKEKKIKRDKNASIIYRGEDNSYYEKFLATGEVKCIDEEIPFEIPTSWSWARLTHVTYLIEDCPHSTAKDEGKGYPLVRTPNIGFGFLQLNGVHRVSEKVYNQRNVRAVPQKNDLIFAREAPAGNIAVIQEEKVCLGQRTVLLRPITNCILPQYLAYYVLAPSSQQNLVEKSFGTTVAHVNLSDFRPYLIPVPPLDEQKRIVNKLIELLPLIDKYNCYGDKLAKLSNEIYTLLKKSILQEAIQGKLVPQIAEEGTAQELLEQIKAEKQKLVKEGKLKKTALATSTIFRGDDNKYYEQIGKKCLDITEQIPFEIPNSWTWARMGQIGDWGAGSTPLRSNQDYYGGNILWLKTGELNNATVYDTEEKITQRAFQDCSLRINKKGDVLIAMYGATIGKLAIVGKELTTNQACCGCTPYVVYNWFLFYFLMASRDTFIKKGEGGAQPNISRIKLVEHLIPLPPLNEQKRIVKRILKIRNL